MKRNDSHTPAHRVRRKFPLDDSLFSDSRIEPGIVIIAFSHFDFYQASQSDPKLHTVLPDCKNIQAVILKKVIIP